MHPSNPVDGEVWSGPAELERTVAERGGGGGGEESAGVSARPV